MGVGSSSELESEPDCESDRETLSGPRATTSANVLLPGPAAFPVARTESAVVAVRPGAPGLLAAPAVALVSLTGSSEREPGTDPTSLTRADEAPEIFLLEDIFDPQTQLPYGPYSRLTPHKKQKRLFDFGSEKD